MDFSYLKTFMDGLCGWRIPGNSISVHLGGKEVFRYTSGFSDVENKLPMQENMMFNIYSCSKVTTVTAALQLYEKGIYLLDDPLYDFIPEYRDMYVMGENGEPVKAHSPITMRQLFTMTAGFDYNFSHEVFTKTAKELTDGKMNTLTVAKCAAKKPLCFHPGAKWQYSMCHDILAAAVEAISGKKFRDYVQQNIFDPLGMKDSTYHPTSAHTERMAVQYNFKDANEDDMVKLQLGEVKSTGGKLVRMNSDVIIHRLGSEYDGGGAGITTTVEDYVKLCSALALGGKGESGERILAPNTVELMHTNQLSGNLMNAFSNGHYAGYGYGLGVRTMVDKAHGGSLSNIGEFGWGGAAGATVLCDTSIGLGVFYTHHMLNPQEHIYQPRLRNVIYTCLSK